MNEVVSSILFLIGAVLACCLAIWLYIFLPSNMAKDRNRDPVIWVLISIVGSPLLAILLLIALGDAKA